MTFDERIAAVYFDLMEIAKIHYCDERAQDLAADAVLKALEARDRYDDSLPLLPWCRAIMRNLWLNTEQRLSSTHTQRLGDWDAPSNEQADQRVRVNEVLAIIDEMSRRSVAVETLVEFAKGYSVAEIATAKGVPEGTVKRRIHDARKLLATLVNVK